MEKYYELTYTISKSLSREEAVAFYEKILSYFPNAIQKDKGKDDFFSLEFLTESEMITDLEKKLKSEPLIKKYMIVKKEAVKAFRQRMRKPALLIPTVAPDTGQKVEKAELNKIDEKLKEIFGE